METDTKKHRDRSEKDTYLYAGQVNLDGHDLLRGCLAKAPKKDARLILVTVGGDPHAAYKMALTMRRHHKGDIEICVPSLCKSAGTLLCIGANSLVIGDEGELGPLDVQYEKKDELRGRMSGLDIIQAIADLRRQTLVAFDYFLHSIGGSRPNKQMVKIATDLTRGFIGPIAGRIDPIMLGAHNRGMDIASHYGTRLNDRSKALKSSDALDQLIAGYPSHRAIIDRDEAKNLFNKVTEPDKGTLELLAKVEADIGGSFEEQSFNPEPVVKIC